MKQLDITFKELHLVTQVFVDGKMVGIVDGAMNDGWKICFDPDGEMRHFGGGYPTYAIALGNMVQLLVEKMGVDKARELEEELDKHAGGIERDREEILKGALNIMDDLTKRNY